MKNLDFIFIDSHLFGKIHYYRIIITNDKLLKNIL